MNQVSLHKDNMENFPVVDTGLKYKIFTLKYNTHRKSLQRWPNSLYLLYQINTLGNF